MVVVGTGVVRQLLTLSNYYPLLGYFDLMPDRLEEQPLRAGSPDAARVSGAGYEVRVFPGNDSDFCAAVARALRVAVARGNVLPSLAFALEQQYPSARVVGQHPLAGRDGGPAVIYAFRDGAVATNSDAPPVGGMRLRWFSDPR